MMTATPVYVPQGADANKLNLTFNTDGSINTNTSTLGSYTNVTIATLATQLSKASIVPPPSDALSSFSMSSPDQVSTLQLSPGGPQAARVWITMLMNRNPGNPNIGTVTYQINFVTDTQYTANKNAGGTGYENPFTANIPSGQVAV